jgi:SAM-dependent methyltransferase
MDHRDHVALLAPGVVEERRGAGATWADMGAGTGAFTRALAELTGPGSRIVAVDRDRGALAENAQRTHAAYPDVHLETLAADFTGPLDLTGLDGLVAANSLHFVAPHRQVAIVRGLAERLRPGGVFLVVEYDADRGNRWVPHPFRLDGWRAIAADAGLVDVRELARAPGSFLGGFYSAMGRRPGSGTEPARDSSAR